LEVPFTSSGENKTIENLPVWLFGKFMNTNTLQISRMKDIYTEGHLWEKTGSFSSSFQKKETFSSRNH
jgi:hypothetical protein